MDASRGHISPLRQRMIDDMRDRKLSEKTQSHYLRWVQRFAAFLGRSADTATVEELRRYQLHLVEYARLEWVDCTTSTAAASSRSATCRRLNSRHRTINSTSQLPMQPGLKPGGLLKIRGAFTQAS